MQKEIKHRWFYRHGPEKVWNYLTKLELMEQWLMKNDFLPLTGYDFQFRAQAIPSINFDGIVYCKVLEIGRSRAAYGNAEIWEKVLGWLGCYLTAQTSN